MFLYFWIPFSSNKSFQLSEQFFCFFCSTAIFSRFAFEVVGRQKFMGRFRMEKYTVWWKNQVKIIHELKVIQVSVYAFCPEKPSELSLRHQTILDGPENLRKRQSNPPKAYFVEYRLFESFPKRYYHWRSDGRIKSYGCRKLVHILKMC